MSTDRIRNLCGNLLTVMVFAGAAALAAPLSATAAQITVSNCQSTKVRICSFDNKEYNVDGNRHSHNLAQNEQGHFKCKANCVFKIVDCSEHTGCDECKHNGLWLNHSWGKGTYNLVGLATQEHQDEPTVYKSSNLVKTDSDVICE